jgi:integrase
VYGSEESHREYKRVVAEVSSAPAQAVPASGEITVDELLVAFMEHARRHYRRSDGSLTDQVVEFKNALKPVHAIYGHIPAVNFGPLALKTVRQAYIGAGNCRTLINSRVGKIKRVFKWAVENELVPVATYTALATVAGLQEGRTDARESEPVTPVADEIVDATLPHLNRHVAGMVTLQRLTGCRPGEAAAIRQCDIDMTGDVWTYSPPQHKTRHKGKGRTIAIGPKGQELLRSFFTDNPTDYLFSPRRAKEEFNATRAANRKTPFWPSHAKQNAKRRKVNPKRTPAEKYTRQAYLTAVVRACDRAQVEHWFPYQLRHSVATTVRKVHGLEAAQVLLGHARANVTETYAQRDASLAAKVAGERG